MGPASPLWGVASPCCAPAAARSMHPQGTTGSGAPSWCLEELSRAAPGVIELTPLESKVLGALEM